MRQQEQERMIRPHRSNVIVVALKSKNDRCGNVSSRFIRKRIALGFRQFPIVERTTSEIRWREWAIFCVSYMDNP